MHNFIAIIQYTLPICLLIIIWKLLVTFASGKHYSTYPHSNLLFFPTIFASLISGIYLQKHFPQNLLLLLPITIFSFLFLIILVQTAKRKFLLPTQSYILFFFAGALLLFCQKTLYKNQLNIITKETVDIIARITSKTKLISNKFKELIIIETNQITKSSTNNILPINCTFWCYLKSQTNFLPEDYIKLRTIKIPALFSRLPISGNPSFEYFLIKENILATLFPTKSSCTIIKHGKKSLLQLFAIKRESIFTKLKSKLPTLTFSYFAPIFLGNKNAANQQKIKNLFSFWGISHHLARSGLHIALFIFILKIICSLLPIVFVLKQVIFLGICIAYAFLSWSSISFFRALSLFVFYKTGNLLNRQVNFLHLLTLTGLTIILFNPTQLFFLDFQLSFGLTFALAWIYQPKIATNNMRKNLYK